MLSRAVAITTILLAFATNLTFAAEGTYQKTRDGKTIVWNSDPKSGDEATWSGPRDSDGYAKGFGTLTWYTVESGQSGKSKPAFYARYFGNMDRGKLNGPVNVHSKGKTDHAIFVDGVRTTRWARGTVPSWRMADRETEAVRQGRAVAEKKAKAAPEPEAPAEGPPGPPKAEKPGEKKLPAIPAVSESNSAPPNDAKPVQPGTVTKKTGPKRPAPPRSDSAAGVGLPAKNSTVALPSDGAKPPVDDSLRLLTGPPASLHAETRTGPPNSGPAHLTKQEVIDLADAQALSRGFSLGGYSRPDPKYNQEEGTWSISYERTSMDEEPTDRPSRFSITVDDQTKGTVFVPGK